MYNLGGWIVGISSFIDMLVEHPYLKDDPAKRDKALGLIVVWLGIAVATFLVVLVGGILLVEAVSLTEDVAAPLSFLVFAASFMLIFAVWLYGPKITLAILWRRSPRSEE